MGLLLNTGANESGGHVKKEKTTARNLQNCIFEIFLWYKKDEQQKNVLRHERFPVYYYFLSKYKIEVPK